MVGVNKECCVDLTQFLPWWQRCNARSNHARLSGLSVTLTVGVRFCCGGTLTHEVVDLASFKELLRYANYSDPYSVDAHGEVDYGAAICMRGDLGKNGTSGAGGCYDTKVTSFNHGFWNLSAEVVNGPSSTASAATSVNPPFAWRAVADNHTSHAGLPVTFDFPFVRVTALDL